MQSYHLQSSLTFALTVRLQYQIIIYRCDHVSVYLFVFVVPLRGLEAFAAGEKRLLLGRQDVDFVCNA